MMLLDCEDDLELRSAIRMSDVSDANLLYNESKVECEPAETHLDETI